MGSIFLLIFLTICFGQNRATNIVNQDFLVTMLSRLETLEMKSKNYDVLLNENELLKKRMEENEARIFENKVLKKRVTENEARILELTITVKNLQDYLYKKRKEDEHFNTQKNNVSVVTESQSREFAPKTKMLKTKMLLDSKPENEVRNDPKSEERIQKRIYITADEPPVVEKVAFYAYLTHDTQPNLPKSYILKFDRVWVNIGQGYRSDDGTFTIPQTGVYVFAWTMAVSESGYAITELVVNGEVVGSGYAHAPQGLDYGTGIVVVQAVAGDHVFIRMQENGGVVHSNKRGRTSFSGWLLFTL